MGWYIIIAIGIVWVISKHNDKKPYDEEIILSSKGSETLESHEERIAWVNELIEQL